MTRILTLSILGLAAFSAIAQEAADVFEPLEPAKPRNPFAPREPIVPAEPVESLDIPEPAEPRPWVLPEALEATELLSLEGSQDETAGKYEPGTELYVTASSLGFRKGPRRDAMLIRYLPRDTKLLTIFDVLDPVSFSIDGLHGHWAYVQFGNHKGYVFDGYLARTPPSLEKMLDWLCVPGQRVGPITYTTTYDLLTSIFGIVNVSDAEFPLGEGEFEPGTAVFADSIDKKLLIQWEVFHEVPQSVIVIGHKWKTPRGVALGTRLSSLVGLNGGPISFAGFGWDYGGFVTSWRGGALEEDHPLRQGITLHLSPRKPYLPSDYDQLRGDTEYSSDNPAVGKLNVEVSDIMIIINPTEE